MAAVLPLLGLRAFVEVGRLGSVKAAAHRLAVTPGAVSQQIKLLEGRVGVALFKRERQGLRLTEAALSAHPTLLKAFAQIEAGLEMLEISNARPRLNISAMPSFAAAWLVPRLGRFTERHPDIEVRVEASTGLVDLARDRVDIAIRHGMGDYPGLHSRLLFAPVLLPVASPALLAAGPRISVPQDCLAYPLLHDSERADWRLWLKAFGVDDLRATQGTRFGDDFLLIRARAGPRPRHSRTRGDRARPAGTRPRQCVADTLRLLSRHPSCHGAAPGNSGIRRLDHWGGAEYPVKKQGTLQ